MKKSILTLGFGIALTSCATFNVTVYKPNGEIQAKHETPSLYVGTQAFIVDAIVDPFVMVYSLFVQTPVLKSSTGEKGGMTLGSYLSSVTSIVPVAGIGGLNGVNRITFDATDGTRYTYEGSNYKLERQTKAKRPKK